MDASRYKQAIYIVCRVDTNRYVVQMKITEESQFGTTVIVNDITKPVPFKMAYVIAETLNNTALFWRDDDV